MGRCHGAYFSQAGSLVYTFFQFFFALRKSLLCLRLRRGRCAFSRAAIVFFSLRAWPPRRPIAARYAVTVFSILTPCQPAPQPSTGCQRWRTRAHCAQHGVFFGVRPCWKKAPGPSCDGVRATLRGVPRQIAQPQRFADAASPACQATACAFAATMRAPDLPCLL